MWFLHFSTGKQIGTQRGATIINRRGPGSPFIGQSPHATMKSDHEPQTSGVKVNKYWVLTVCKSRIVSQCSTNLDLVFWSLWPWYAIPIFCQLCSLKRICTSLDRIDSSPSKLPQLPQLQQISSHHGFSMLLRWLLPPHDNATKPTNFRPLPSTTANQENNNKHRWQTAPCNLPGFWSRCWKRWWRKSS